MRASSALMLSARSAAGHRSALHLGAVDRPQELAALGKLVESVRLSVAHDDRPARSCPSPCGG